ncbi:hypothetical protein CPB83DRAFT_844782 [Crepidotus variabilis]|uniref:Uncharacterized protein n=1 Tax=Crepidotus variabilis TaxID=179855 RepID=A0A9P6JVF4_9AGAR|nr:hypothetical protein CPB83DRAFT_844782 [Crepidotus variabilis]
MALSSLTHWSQEHIRRVFESDSDVETMEAIEATFSRSIRANINGSERGYEQIKHSVLALRQEVRENGLKVVWHSTVEAPADETNKRGSFGGAYTIHGIRRKLPGSEELVNLARHKVVTVRIESSSNNGGELEDDRKIVHLVFVASDQPA